MGCQLGVPDSLATVTILFNHVIYCLRAQRGYIMLFSTFLKSLNMFQNNVTVVVFFKTILINAFKLSYRLFLTTDGKDEHCT